MPIQFSPMNPDLKPRWIEALRSQRYTQGPGRLRTKDNRFCCLGVLLDLLHPDAWEPSENCPAARMNAVNGPSCSTFSDSLRTETGLDTNALIRLIRLNDHEYQSFAEIATWIENHL